MQKSRQPACPSSNKPVPGLVIIVMGNRPVFTRPVTVGIPLDRAVKDVVGNSAEDDHHRPRTLQATRNTSMLRPALNKSVQVFGCGQTGRSSSSNLAAFPRYHISNGTTCCTRRSHLVGGLRSGI